MTNNQQVSFHDELLILVDSQDSVIEHATKDHCHGGHGILHRAFSVFIFNSKNELMIQKRSAGKRLWPLYWSNSVCSHPRKGENYSKAVKRRLLDEVGLDLPVRFLYQFQYQEKYNHLGSENELCSVYVGKSDELPIINNNEIDDWKYVSLTGLQKDIDTRPEDYTPWFKAELKTICQYFADTIYAMECV